MQGKQLVYRPDIDGLRAIAVILVLLFHFELGVPGGFIGVDVFFVISGFLITGIIRGSMQKGSFSFVDFYIRRLLRLHPALISTVATTLAAAYVIFDPASFSSLAESAKHAILSISNIYFWQHQDYFDASAQTQALLHTWSLAAEWQFYLVWPFIMWAIVKLPKNLSTLTLLSITIASLIASELMLSIDSSAAYFLTPFRIFELSSGGLLAFLSQSQVSDKISSSLFTIGAVSIIASAFLLNSADPFPGLHAVIPVIGTALCIAYGYSSAGAILRIKPAVSIGLISYSVYLVHWPLLVLYKYYVFRELETPDKLALLIVSIALGWLQYKAIERVFISRKQLTLIIGTTLTALGSFAVFIASTSIVNNKGIPSRVPASYLAMASDPVKFHRSNYGGTGFKLETPLGDTSGKKIAVIGGDSFAHQYASGIDKLLKGKGLYIDGIFQHGCVLSGEYTRTLNNVPRQDCRDSYAKIISSLNGNNLPFVFAQSWDGYKNKIVDSAGTLVNSSSDEDYATVITNLLSGVRSDIGDRPFIIVGSQPYLSLSKSAASCLLRPSYVYQRCEESMHYRAEQAYSYKINMILKNFARNHKNTYYIDSFEALCPDGMCSTIESGKILYSDATHLSIDGSTKASTVITNKLTEVSDFH